MNNAPTVPYVPTITSPSPSHVGEENWVRLNLPQRSPEDYLADALEGSILEFKEREEREKARKERERWGAKTESFARAYGWRGAGKTHLILDEAHNYNYAELEHRLLEYARRDAQLSEHLHKLLTEFKRTTHGLHPRRDSTRGRKTRPVHHHHASGLLGYQGGKSHFRPNTTSGCRGVSSLLQRSVLRGLPWLQKAQRAR